jgi:hypothetical protein
MRTANPKTWFKRRTETPTQRLFRTSHPSEITEQDVADILHELGDTPQQARHR